MTEHSSHNANMKKALIIDDDELDLELLRFILSKEGFTVFSTADGPQGIILYKHHHPAIVFLDVGLPSMSGIEVLKEIRTFDDNAQVVLITGYGSPEMTKVATNMGAVEVIEKSWNVEVIASKINATLRTLNYKSLN